MQTQPVINNKTEVLIFPPHTFSLINLPDRWSYHLENMGLEKSRLPSSQLSPERGPLPCKTLIFFES